MNWEAIGAVGEILGALAVVMTLGYLALQVRYARSATVDQSRLARATGVLEMNRLLSADQATRMGQLRNWGLEGSYEQMAEKLGVTVEEASRVDFVNVYHFWLHWSQYASTHDAKDLEELKHIIATFYTLPGVTLSWEMSPIGKPLLEEDFVAFVDEVLDEAAK
jgi:hypothetical protein